MKTCTLCGEDKPITEYYTYTRKTGRKAGSTGYQARCKPCLIELSRQRWANKGEQYTLGLRSSQYGIPVEVLECMYEEFKNCMICNKPEKSTLNGKIKRLSIDHDHNCCNSHKSCGECTRGLLCARCNGTAGVFEDDELLIKTAEYLDAFQSRESLFMKIMLFWRDNMDLFEEYSAGRN